MTPEQRTVALAVVTPDGADVAIVNVGATSCLDAARELARSLRPHTVLRLHQWIASAPDAWRHEIG